MIMAGIDWKLIKAGCPRCGATRGGSRGLHYHALSVWCLGCGWSMNWDGSAGELPKL